MPGQAAPRTRVYVYMSRVLYVWVSCHGAAITEFADELLAGNIRFETNLAHFLVADNSTFLCLKRQIWRFSARTRFLNL